jgi:signal transduction histidine kinase
VAGALTTLQWLVTVGFVVLGLLSLSDWLRHRGDRRGYLAAALGLLAVVSLAGRVSAATGGRFAGLTTPVTLVLFMASGYAVLGFRGTFIPVRRSTRVFVLFLAAASTVFYLAFAPTPGTVKMSLPQAIALLAVIAVWCAMVGDPVVRFWLAARDRPIVQRLRLRLLSIGLAAIIFILIVAGAGGARLGASLAFKIALELIALLSIPLIYAGFAPPSWLIRAWREREDVALRKAVRELVLFSPDRATLARRALDWALQILGAQGAAILDGQQVLAIEGMEPELARQLSRALPEAREARILHLDEPSLNAVVVPLALENRRGAIVATSDGFMPLFGSDELLRLEEFAIDLTAGLDRVRITERMAELERSKSQFLNLASHELRTPLSVIRGYVSMLEAGSVDTSTVTGRNVLSILSAKAMEMNRLIEQMLDAARLEEGRLALHVETIDARDAVVAAVEVVRPLSDLRHRMVVDCGQSSVWINADRDRLGTVLVNLIENAVKYSPAGGEVRCSVRAENGRAILSIQDHGIGIASQDQALLFTKFGRLSKDATQNIPGTGLGLYLSRELARQQGGDITVDSIPGEGSTFTVAFPVVAAAIEPQPIPLASFAELESTG